VALKSASKRKMHLFDGLIKPEKRALFYAACLIMAIALYHQSEIANAGFVFITAITILGLWLISYLVTHAALLIGFPARCLLTAIIGIAAACLQIMLHPPQSLDRGITLTTSGIVTAIDGAIDRRIRLWVALDTSYAPLSAQPYPLIRISTDRVSSQVTIGDHIAFKARLYPSPSPILPQNPNYALQAQIHNVTASGFVIGDLTRIGDQRDRLADRLGRFRHDFAQQLDHEMALPTGGIAAALMVGDRRFISEPTYEKFRKSGLAHLLAISGLHMGLLCFGVIAALRAMASLAPSFSMRVPIHKYAAFAGVLTGLGYVFISGASISAVRAFIMAVFVISAILLDRLALTLRNVALTAIFVLIVNPAALYTAGFQLSFAATTALVAWYEISATRHHRHRHQGPRNRLVTYIGGVIVASLIAATATAPFTAQHFGAVTPWGVMANIVGIPLTGLWIMPSGILTAIGYVTGLEAYVIGVMQQGIEVLIGLAGFISSLPLAGWRISPPGNVVLAVLSSGCLVLIGCHRRVYPLGVLLICFAGLMWWQTAIPHGVLFAKGQTRFLILAGQDGIAYSHSTQNHRRLSSFFTDIAERQLARPVHPAPPCKPFCTHYAPDGRKVTIVDRTFNLTKACNSAPDIILSLVPVKYPCRNKGKIYDLTLLYGYNSLIYIDNTESVYISNNSVSNQRVCPVPQQHPC
jgi:competence protein ComEC